MGVSFYCTNGTNEPERFLLDKLLVIIKENFVIYVTVCKFADSNKGT